MNARTSTRLLVLLCLGLVLVAGCSAPAPTGPSPASDTFPMTLTSPYGTTELEGAPTRVAAVGPLDAEIALALGVTPVIASTSVVRFEFQRDAGGARIGETFNSQAALPYERIAAARPDVILATSLQNLEEAYPLLARIAPVVTPERADEVRGVRSDWRRSALAVGRGLGKAEEARRRVEGVDARLAEIRDAHPEYRGKTATIALDYADRVSLLSYPGSPADGLLTAMGFTSNPRAAGIDPRRPDVSDERFSLLDGDVLLVAHPGGPERQRRMEESAVFRGLGVVRNGGYRALPLEPNGTSGLAWTMVSPSLLGLEWVIPRIESEIDAAMRRS